MYESYFGMKQRPFSATPQLGAYFASAGQEEAIATLRYGITQSRGVGILTGAPGTGKTILCHRLADSLEPRHTTAMITNTGMTTAKALLQAIVYDLGIEYRGLEEQELRLALSDYLYEKCPTGARTVLIIDEAQSLTPTLLEELRMLSNFEAENEKLLHIVLAGQPTLVANLRRPGLESLDQRVGVRAVLGPMSDDETIGYIRKHLEFAGAMPERIFSYAAMSAAYEATGGVPRLVNQLCEHALLMAYVADAPRVEESTIEQATADLSRGGEPTEADATVDFEHATISAEPDHESLVIKESRKSQAPSPVAIESTASSPTSALAPTIVIKMVAPELVVGSRSTVSVESTSREKAATDAIGTECNPLDEAFDQEEVIVDQYAMMDAAKTSGRTAPTKRITTPTARGCDATAKQSNDSACRPTGAASFESRNATSVTGDFPIVTSAPAATPKPCSESSPQFVESSDNAAAFEVGAGRGAATDMNAASVKLSTAQSTEPELILIEPRSKRVAGNRVRIDGPQPAAHRGPGAYRRLFTYARRT